MTGRTIIDIECVPNSVAFFLQFFLLGFWVSSGYNLIGLWRPLFQRDSWIELYWNVLGGSELSRGWVLCKGCGPETTIWTVFKSVRDDLLNQSILVRLNRNVITKWSDRLSRWSFPIRFELAFYRDTWNGNKSDEQTLLEHSINWIIVCFHRSKSWKIAE